MWTKRQLIQFEEDIEAIYAEGRIRGPVHLSRGNESQLIKIFKNYIHESDWVLSSHRSHYHALLKGIPPEWVKDEILAGRSIHLNNREHKFLTSAIVGGNLSIGLGIALALKLKGFKNRVWVFCGDMAAETGIFHECTKYALRNELPISFVVENDGLSVNTPTQETWGKAETYQKLSAYRYKYTRKTPHIGIGRYVTFT